MRGLFVRRRCLHDETRRPFGSHHGPAKGGHALVTMHPHTPYRNDLVWSIFVRARRKSASQGAHAADTRAEWANLAYPGRRLVALTASARETTACLDVAVALGYVEQIDGALLGALDRVCATLVKNVV